MLKIALSIVLLFCCSYSKADNLLRHGSFDGDVPNSEVRTNGGKFTIFTEELTWNQCGKLELDRVYESADEKKHSASVWIGGEGRLPGFPVKPETKYRFSVEVRGEVPGSASISAVCWHGDDIWKDYKAINTSVGGFQVQKSWTLYKGSFTTRADAKRAALNLQIWESSKHGPLKYKVGDHILFDNVEISEETRSLSDITSLTQPTLLEAGQTEATDEKQSEEKGASTDKRKFLVAVVSPTSNFAIPFIPDEIFQPATEITVSAAINELKGVPIALANLTDQAAEYQVLLETCGKYNGEYGLLNFPKTQFVMRQALRFKDSDQDVGSLRLDPLPKMNQASTLMVLPKEAGLIWLDFDTSGVAPGKYQGRLRVIPLSEPATWETVKGAYWNRKYTGAMQDIPFTLEVRDLVLSQEPSLPMGFFQSADNEQCFQLMLQVGTRNIGLSPWSFKFPIEDGRLIPDQVSDELLAISKTVGQHEEWARKYQVTLTYFIGFSAYHAFEQLYGVTKKPELKKQLWPQWIKAVNAYMNSLGVGPERYAIETWDEPHPDKFPELLESHQLAKAADPKVRLTLTLGAHIMSAQQMESLSALTDEWTLWSDGYFKKPEHLQLLKQLQQRGVLIRHYTCDTSMRSSLARRYQRNAWFGEYHQLNGNEMYQFADTYGGRGASDWKVCTGGGIVYKLFDEYLPSIRYMALRQGMTDIKYLDKLRQIGKGNPEAEALLAEAARRVVIDFGHDPTMPDQVREEAAKLIIKLQQN